MKKILFVSVFLIIIYHNSFSQWTVNSVPDPKSSGSGFVSNPDNILSNDELAELNNIISELKDSTTSEIAVVMLQSIGEEVPKTFATELFNTWHIGNSKKDNGLLILFVMDQRRIEFETGYGIEGVLTDAKCYSIQQQFMVPNFKQGNYGQGIIDGVKESIKVLTSSETAASELEKDNVSNQTTNSDEISPFKYYEPKWYSPFINFYYM